jgi:hypothetical protein
LAALSGCLLCLWPRMRLAKIGVKRRVAAYASASMFGKH